MYVQQEARPSVDIEQPARDVGLCSIRGLDLLWEEMQAENLACGIHIDCTECVARSAAEEYSTAVYMLYALTVDVASKSTIGETDRAGVFAIGGHVMGF